MMEHILRKILPLLPKDENSGIIPDQHQYDDEQNYFHKFLEINVDSIFKIQEIITNSEDLQDQRGSPGTSP